MKSLILVALVLASLAGGAATALSFRRPVEVVVAEKPVGTPFQAAGMTFTPMLQTVSVDNCLRTFAVVIVTGHGKGRFDAQWRNLSHAGLLDGQQDGVEKVALLDSGGGVIEYNCDGYQRIVLGEVECPQNVQITLGAGGK